MSGSLLLLIAVVNAKAAVMIKVVDGDERQMMVIDLMCRYLLLLHKVVALLRLLLACLIVHGNAEECCSWHSHD